MHLFMVKKEVFECLRIGQKNCNNLVTFITYCSYSKESSDNNIWVIEKSTLLDEAH